MLTGRHTAGIAETAGAAVDRRGLGPLLAATALLGAFFVAFMPAGLPYDEPSHWANVLFYADQARLPELGEAGVTYEAQQGPVAYVMDAAVAAPLRLISDSAAFYGVRVLGLLEHLLLTWLIWRIALRALPQKAGAGLLAGVAVGLNPMLLTMSTSVQNDTPALVLAAAAIVVGMRPAPSTRQAVLAGVLVGLAMLTKIIVWPIAVALGVWLLWKGRLKLGVAYGLPAALLIGWWIARNYALYGDATGQAGVQAAGFSFPALSSLDPVSLARNAVTYLWLPNEYLRNTVEPPLLVVGLVGAATVVGGLGMVLLVRYRQELRWDFVLALAAPAAAAAFSWFFVVQVSQAVSFRFAYAALPFWFVSLGALAFLQRWAWVLGGLAVAMIGMSLWVLTSVAGLPDFPFLIPL